MRRRAFRLGQREQDLDDELAFHLRERERELVAAGQDPIAARARALDQFGDLHSVRAECLSIDRDGERATRWSTFGDNLRQDIVYALRTMRRQPAFTIVVLLILGIGIGANTAIFTLVDALLLRPLPVSQPERLVSFGDPRLSTHLSSGDPRTRIASYPLYLDLRDQVQVLSGLYATGRSEQLDVHVRGGSDLTHPRGRYVSGNYFSVLGVAPVFGRAFAAEEDRAPGASPVVLVSYDYWQRALAADPATLGRTISVNGVPLTVIGVTPPDFAGDVIGQATDMWIPITMQPSLMPGSSWLSDRGVSWLLLMGRLRPGASITAARAELTALATRSLTDHANATQRGAVERNLREKPILVGPGALGFSYYRGVYARDVVTLMAAVGLVLLIVCANVANLLLARAVARAREISVRIAIGAGRLRLVQQLLTESMVLAVAGALLGLVAAIVGSRTLLRLVGNVVLQVRLDAHVLGFTVAISLLTALLFGLLPALRGTRLPVAAALRTQGRGVASPAVALGRWLVVAQVAVSMLLVIGAGMLARSTMRLISANVGVERDKLVIADIDARRSGYSEVRLVALMRDLTARVQQVPGVAAASLSENGIFSGTESGTAVQVEGFTARADSDSLVAEDIVGPDYFHAVGAHILRGRDIQTRDNETGAKVGVVNASFARFFFPGGDAVGRHVVADSATWEIVGIVSDIRQNGVRDEPARRIYGSIYQVSGLPGHFRIEIRATGNPARLVVPVRQALLSANPSLAVMSVNPLTVLISDSIRGDRLVAMMVSSFGLLALILAALGLYGVMAYTTVRRTAEFGLRIALGAAPGAVRRMVLGDAVRMTALGMVIGLPMTLLAAHLERGQLFGISFFDPPSIGLATVVLGLSAVIAAYLPAIRASRVAPLEAIHAE